MGRLNGHIIIWPIYSFLKFDLDMASIQHPNQNMTTCYQTELFRLNFCLSFNIPIYRWMHGFPTYLRMGTLMDMGITSFLSRFLLQIWFRHMTPSAPKSRDDDLLSDQIIPDKFIFIFIYTYPYMKISWFSLWCRCIGVWLPLVLLGRQETILSTIN